MKWLEQQLDIYGSQHTKLVTTITHLVGVPLVILSLLIALAWFKFSFPPLFITNLAWLSVTAVSLFYIYLDWRLGLCLSVMLLLMAWVASLLAAPQFTLLKFFMFVALFIMGWVIQLIGHFFESKKLICNFSLSQWLITPIFLVAEIAVMIGWRKDLRELMQTHSEIKF